MKKNSKQKILASTMMLLGGLNAGTAQSLDRMIWYNEPQQWAVEDGTLTTIGGCHITGLPLTTHRSFMQCMAGSLRPRLR